MSPLLADAVLAVHFLFILFVLGGELCIVIGGLRGWAWVRNLRFRAAHLAAIAFVIAESWIGMVCPLTAWEDALRRSAGESPYGESFVGYWLGRLVYYDAPGWVFAAAYTAFGLAVAASWFFVRPGERRNRASKA